MKTARKCIGRPKNEAYVRGGSRERILGSDDGFGAAVNLSGERGSRPKNRTGIKACTDSEDHLQRVILLDSVRMSESVPRAGVRSENLSNSLSFWCSYVPRRNLDG
jgi:hypothetical protein